MTEIDKNVLKEIADKQKVEVVVKRDASSRTGEIDIVRAFSNMGKKKRIYAWLIVICMLVGLSVPLLMAELKEKTEKVSAVISFVYPDAKEQLTPNGDPLDVNYLTSSFIIQNALKRTSLSESVPISAIERNINIESLLSEDTRQRLEVVEKVIKETGKDYEEVLKVDYDYEGKYIVSLTNGFTTDPEGKNKVFLKGEELTSLLNNILESYNEYFFDTYMNMALPDNSLASINSLELDYIERLDEVVNLLDNLVEYCSDKDKGDYLEYRSKYDGLSFSDIKDCINLVRDIDVDYLYAYVFYNNIAKDKKSMITKYEYSLKNCERDIEVIKGNIENNSALISEYKNEKITVSTPEQGAGTEISVVTDYYNELILKQADYYSYKSKLGERIANLNEIITGFKNSNSTQTQTDYVEGELESLVKVCSTLYDLTKTHAEEIIESDSYKNSMMNYIGAQYLGESFFNSSNIKKACIGMAAGLFAALLIWGFDALIEEIKRSSSVARADKEGRA